MENLYLFNTVDGVGKGHTYIDKRNGPDKLENTKLTLVHPFYNEQARFNRQVEVWRNWSDYVRDRVNIIIVDDGSPNPVRNYITPEIDKLLSNFNFSIQRIKKDLKWNTPGALNVGLVEAPTEWVLIMDSDCAFDNENMEKLLKADPESFAVYKFPRQRMGRKGDHLDNRRFLPCTMLFHRSLFLDKVGGFDEDYTGEYSGGYAFFDTDFDERAYLFKCENPMFIWNSVTATEWMPSITKGEIVKRTDKDQNVNRRLLQDKRAKRRETLDIKNPGPILRFEYEQVYKRERS